MKRSLRRAFILALAFACLAALIPAAAEETQAEDARYTFGIGIEDFDARLQKIFSALESTYTMGEEPNIQGAYEYHLPNNVYAKALTYDGEIEYVLVFLNMEHSQDQSALWQYAAFMASVVGDMPASTWAVLLLEATNLTLETGEADSCAFGAGNLIMICQTDPEQNLLYAVLERQEYELNETMDGSFTTS
jgi:hypothetical protein